ncbi:hypothetical protein [Streptomyces hydrogenans]|uniref:hypothetical protein n=1 Tax=Streptomyces hydrogenans TaxID=1873719 RepID=UPI00381EA759
MTEEKPLLCGECDEEYLPITPVAYLARTEQDPDGDVPQRRIERRPADEEPPCTHLRVRFDGSGGWKTLEAPPGRTLREQLDLALLIACNEVQELRTLPGRYEDLTSFWMGPEDGIATFHPAEEGSYVFRAHPIPA